MNNQERIKRRIERDKQRRYEKKRKALEKYDDFTRAFDYEHVWNSAQKVCTGVRWKASVQRWENHLLTNAGRVYADIHSGALEKRSGRFCCFTLSERGHTRNIRALKIDERTAQKCLCDYSLVPAITRSLIYDNGATLKDKGTGFAERRLMEHLRNYARTYGVSNVLDHGYVVQFDFRHYFDNADHGILFEIIDGTYQDQRLNRMAKKFILDFGRKGLGLGSQVSQVLALALASRLDHTIKDKLRMKWYARYNDDGYILCKDKEEAHMVMDTVCKIAEELHIIINPKKTRIVKFSRGFSFLQIRYSMTDTGKIVRRISKSGIQREKRRFRAFRKHLDDGTMQPENVEMSVSAYLNNCMRGDSWHIRQRMIKTYRRMFPECRKEI